MLEIKLTSKFWYVGTKLNWIVPWPWISGAVNEMFRRCHIDPISLASLKIAHLPPVFDNLLWKPTHQYHLWFTYQYHPPQDHAPELKSSILRLQRCKVVARPSDKPLHYEVATCFTISSRHLNSFISSCHRFLLDFYLRSWDIFCVRNFVFCYIWT